MFAPMYSNANCGCRRSPGHSEGSVPYCWSHQVFMFVQETRLCTVISQPFRAIHDYSYSRRYLEENRQLV